MILLHQTQREEHLIHSLQSQGRVKELAVKELIDRHAGYIYRLHRDMGLAEEVLKDIYTDTVISVVRQVEEGHFRGDSKLSSYFFRIFYFKTIDYLRKEAHSQSRILFTNEVPDLGDSNSWNGTIHDGLDSEDRLKQISAVLNKMCPLCRSLIDDWILKGYTVQEMAERMGETDIRKFSRTKYKCTEKFKSLWNQQMRVLAY